MFHVSSSCFRILAFEIREEDRHLAGFRDAGKKLWQYVIYGFGLKTVAAVFASHVGEQLMPVKSKGVRNWLDDIMVPTKTVEGQFQLLRQRFDCLQKGYLSMNLHESERCKAIVEWLGMIIDRSCIRPAPSKIETISQRSQATIVEDVRVLLAWGDI